MKSQKNTQRPLRVRFRQPMIARKVVVLAGVLALVWGLSGASVAEAADANFRFGFRGGRFRIGGFFGSWFGHRRRFRRRPPTIELFTAGSHRVPLGSPFTLTWKTHRATSVKLIGPRRSFDVAQYGSISRIARIAGTKHLKLVASNRWGTTVRDLYVHVFPRPRPVRILSFSADRLALYAPGSANLSWHVIGAQRVQLVGPRGRAIDVPASGTWTAHQRFRGARTYRLIAIGRRGRQTQALLTITAY